MFESFQDSPPTPIQLPRQLGVTPRILNSLRKMMNILPYAPHRLWLVVLSFLLLNTSFAQEQLVLKAATLPAADTVLIFTPQGYDPTAKAYPAVIMLHGWSGNYKQWDNIMNAQQYADEYGFIIICPDGLKDSWYINSPKKKNSQYEDFFFKYLLPAVKQKYRIDAANLFITGLSMGGHGALYLFARRPDLFRSAGSTSGVMDLRTSSDKYGLKAVLGDLGTQQVDWIRYSVLGSLDKLATARKEFIFDCGTEDQLYSLNNELRLKCDELNIPATYISQPGSHDKAYWKKSIRAHFEFFQGLVLQNK